MRFLHKMAAAAFLFSAFAPALRADPYDPKQIPEDAKFVLHVDLDGLQGSKIWDAIHQKLMANPDFQAGISQMETVTGVQFPQNMHDLTLYGRVPGDEAGVILVHAKGDQNKVMTVIQGLPDYSSVGYGDYTIVSWTDKGKKLFGSFQKDDLVVIAHSQENVQSALDVLAGKSPAVKAESPLAAGAAKGQLIYAGAKDIPSLNKDKNPVLGQMDSGWLSITEKGEDESVQADIQAKTPEAADQMKKMLDGALAMVGVAASAENADPNTKLAAQATQTLNTRVDGKHLIADWAIPATLAQSFIEQMQPPEARETQPTVHAPDVGK